MNDMSSFVNKLSMTPGIAIVAWFANHADNVVHAYDKQAKNLAEKYLRGEIDAYEGSEAFYHLSNHPGDFWLAEQAKNSIENSILICLVELTPFLLSLSSRIPALRVILADSESSNLNVLLNVHDALRDYVYRSTDPNLN